MVLIIVSVYLKFMLRGQFRRKIIFFIKHFYAIMHRTTIVQNKILSIIWSCFFNCPPNIYRPSLGKVWLGRPNQKLIQPLNFYLRRDKKDHSNQNCMHYNGMKPDFDLFLKKIFKNVIKKSCQICLINNNNN